MEKIDLIDMDAFKVLLALWQGLNVFKPLVLTNEFDILPNFLDE